MGYIYATNEYNNEIGAGTVMYNAAVKTELIDNVNFWQQKYPYQVN